MLYVHTYDKESESLHRMLSKINAPYKFLSFRDKLVDEELSNGVYFNWGKGAPLLSHEASTFSLCLNTPQAIASAVNKIACLNKLKSAAIPTVPFTIHKGTALQWLAEEKQVVCRSKVKSCDGDGIQTFSSGELPEVPLYTQYIKKKVEYRVHVFKGEILAVQKKVKNSANPADLEINYQIRTTSGGWGYDVIKKYPSAIETMALRAVDTIGLDFGAVDILYNTVKGFFTLEINTAPELMPTMAQLYANKLNSYIE